MSTKADRIRRERLILLGHYDAHSVAGLAFDKRSRDQEWLLKHGYLKAEIEHHPAGSDWPRIVVKITDKGREAFTAMQGSAPAAS